MMEGNITNINQLPSRNSLISKTEPKTPQSLPFSFNRNAQKARISSVSGIPSLSRPQGSIFSTQSFHLPENATLPASAMGRSSNLFSHKSPYSDPPRQFQVLSQTKLQPCESKTPLFPKLEDQDYKESSPAAFKAHISPFEKPNALSSLSSNVPLFPHAFNGLSADPSRRSVDETHLSGKDLSPEQGRFTPIILCYLTKRVH